MSTKDTEFHPEPTTDMDILDQIDPTLSYTVASIPKPTTDMAVYAFAQLVEMRLIRKTFQALVIEMANHNDILRKQLVIERRAAKK